MNIPTYIANAIDQSSDKSKYDAEVKKVLSDKQILAWILKYSATEYEHYTIEEIMACIEGVPEVATHYVDSDRYMKPVNAMNSEDTVPGESRGTYDIRFRVLGPDKAVLGMIINVEAQKDFFAGHDLVSRGIYYCSRMLSSQISSSVSGREYNSLEKVYSIWICLEPPAYAANSLTRFSMQENQVYGHANFKFRYDLLEVVLVCLEKGSSGDSGTRLHQLLNTVLSTKLSPVEKKDILSTDYQIKVSVELEGGLVSMCNLSEAIEEKALERGWEQGLEQGALRTLLSLIKKGHITVEEAAEEAGISAEEMSCLLEKERLAGVV